MREQDVELVQPRVGEGELGAASGDPVVGVRRRTGRDDLGGDEVELVVTGFRKS
ncbi:hypothetical protein ABZZ80_19835 [Streptomyces sp. NPDC006356]